MYKIRTANDEIMWLNERIIEKITRNEDGSYVIHHFNGMTMLVKHIDFPTHTPN
jgi:uncharacterized protein YlzI (FlbEa/FlbD family)